jgi:hypothetical protein
MVDTQFERAAPPPPAQFDPTPAADCKACGRPTRIERCDQTPLCEKGRKNEEAMQIAFEWDAAAWEYARNYGQVRGSVKIQIFEDYDWTHWVLTGELVRIR